MKIFNRKKKYEAVGWEEIVSGIIAAVFYTGAAVIVLSPIVFVIELDQNIFEHLMGV